MPNRLLRAFVLGRAVSLVIAAAFASTPAGATLIYFGGSCPTCRMDLLALPDTNQEFSMGPGSDVSIGMTHIVRIFDPPGLFSSIVFEGTFSVSAEVFGFPPYTEVIHGTGRFVESCSITGTCYVDGSARVKWVSPELLANLGLPLNFQGGSGQVADASTMEFAYLELGPAIPEPSTFYLMALGCVFLLKLRRSPRRPRSVN